MFVNCGIAVRTETGVQFEIWDGAEKYQFFITTENLSRLLQDEQNVPVGRKFGVFENPEYGRAALTHPNCNGQRKGVVFRVDCLKGRTFSIARRALMQVARGKWAEACVSEMLPDPIPAPGGMLMHNQEANGPCR